MPAKIPRPCRKNGCRGKTADRSGYCSDHMKTESGWYSWQREKGSVTERGYGHDWRKTRRLVIQRDRGLCQECLRNGLTASGQDVDHIQSKSDGGSDDLENLELLCRPCHQRKTAEGRGGSNLCDL